MQPPIACSLGPGGARAQMAEWVQMLGRVSVAVERRSPTRVAFRLADDLEDLTALIDLARREKACCPFFGFSIEIEAHGAALLIEAPAEAAGMLDGFEAAGAQSPQKA